MPWWPGPGHRAACSPTATGSSPCCKGGWEAGGEGVVSAHHGREVLQLRFQGGTTWPAHRAAGMLTQVSLKPVCSAVNTASRDYCVCRFASFGVWLARAHGYACARTRQHHPSGCRNLVLLLTTFITFQQGVRPLQNGSTVTCDRMLHHAALISSVATPRRPPCHTLLNAPTTDSAS